MAEGTKTGQGTKLEQGTQTPAQGAQPDNDRDNGQGLNPTQGDPGAWRPTDDKQQGNSEQLEPEQGSGEGDRAFVQEGDYHDENANEDSRVENSARENGDNQTPRDPDGSGSGLAGREQDRRVY